jgi:segregation and condensation protein A
MSAREKPVEAEGTTSEVFTASLESLTVAGPQIGVEQDSSLILDLDGFEGPLDLLLVLARTQKVDLRKISILALADQYLDFILDARKLRLEIAADYLVMAAWLTYMKSRLLLPEPAPVEGEPSGEELASRLAFQLQRLEAMRNVASRLMSRHRLGREVFARGAPEGIKLIKRRQFAATLFDLLKAYGDQRTHQIAETPYEVRKRTIYAIEEARNRLEGMLGRIPDWSRLDAFLPERAPALGDDRRTFLASSLSAALDLVKDGHAEIRQEGVFAPVYLRARIRVVPPPDARPPAPPASE